MSVYTKGRELRLGVIGLGMRSGEQLKVLLDMEDVNIAAVCDLYPDRIEKAQKTVRAKCGDTPFGTQNYLDVLRREDVEAVIIMTDWQTHIRIAVDAMRHGKTPGMEVGGAASLDECWQLVRTSELTGIPCMMLENCCYGKEEMTLLSMVRQGIFGEIVHCKGAYAHDLREEIGYGDVNRHYRQHHFMHRNGELYPTHELGPIAKYLRINRGNRMLRLTSMASKAAGQKVWMQTHRAGEEIADAVYQCGDVVTTMIQCANGETILLTHDCTLPRAYSRGACVQGTKGIWMEDNRSLFIDGRSPVNPNDWTHRWESDAAYMEEYCHPLWRAYAEFGTRGGHSGMDFLVLRAFIESIQQHKPFPIDVYDTASWMCITALSEQSIAMGSMPVAIPDFTDGMWIGPREKNNGPFALD